MRELHLHALAALLAAGLLAGGCGDNTGGEGSTGVGSTNEADGKVGGNIDEDAGGVGIDGAGNSSGGVDDADGLSTSGDGDGGGGTSSSSSGGDTDGGGADGADGGGTVCYGESGCACKSNDECDTGYCLDSPGGKKCAQFCVDSCPKGMVCKDVSGGKGDPVQVCVARLIALCAPCGDDQLCEQNGVKGLCLDYGAQGRFCGGPCEADADCPEHYECVQAEGVSGTKAKQCKLKGDAPESVCGCSEWAVNHGAKTTCTRSNDFGTCKAERACTASGLQPCEAQEAAAEFCDAADNDCNGKVDDLPADYACSNKLFAELGSMATCTTDQDCQGKGKDGAVEKCARAEGAKVGSCRELEGECFGVPSCTAAGKLVCNEAKTPVPEVCDQQDNDCDGKTDETFTWESPDGSKLGIGEPCGLGECGGGNVSCKTLAEAACDTYTKARDEKCDGLDNDCDGKTDNEDKVCDDDNACTGNKCDGKSCAHPPSVDCNDQELCTADACDAKTGTCSHTLRDGASCDDGDACTVGDVCKDDGAGKAVCMSGAVTKDCDDANLCTDDSCDPQKGCVALSNSATQACYSGRKGSEGRGECKGGMQLCKDGVLQGACVGEFTPNNTELCDAKDDDCNGVTDNGCAATLVVARTASATGTVVPLPGAGTTTLTLRLGGESAAQGRAKGAKKVGALGWYAWIGSLLK